MVKYWGIEPQYLTAYPSQRRLSGRRGASGVLTKNERILCLFFQGKSVGKIKRKVGIAYLRPVVYLLQKIMGIAHLTRVTPQPPLLRGEYQQKLMFLGNLG